MTIPNFLNAKAFVIKQLVLQQFRLKLLLQYQNDLLISDLDINSFAIQVGDYYN